MGASETQSRLTQLSPMAEHPVPSGATIRAQISRERSPSYQNPRTAKPRKSRGRGRCTADLIIVARDRTVVRRGAIAEVENNLVHVTPSPAFGWVIAFDDRMARIVKVLRGVAVWRVVATANMAAVRRRRKWTHGEAIFRHSSQPSALGVTSRMASAWVHSSGITVSRCWRGARLYRRLRRERRATRLPPVHPPRQTPQRA